MIDKRRINKRNQRSETFLLGMLLAVTGGFLDAYTYLLRDGVFANAQTGNIVLFGVQIAEQNYKKAGYYLIPIFAFIVGILIAESIRKKFKEYQKVHWRQMVILVEIVVLLLVAFIPVGKFNAVANVLISLVCSLQVESFRKVNGNAFTTTMCTGNLRSGTELLYHYKQTGEKEFLHRALQYFGIIMMFIFGAGIGAAFTNLFGNAAVVICCMILSIVFWMMFIPIKGQQGNDLIP